MRVRGAVEAQQRQVDLMNKLQVHGFISFSVADPDPAGVRDWLKNQNQHPGSGGEHPGCLSRICNTALF
jgi:hypothetical protein